MVIRLKNFPTHIAVSDNKTYANRYMKINGQSIYNGKLNRFSRNIAIKNLHNYITSQLPKNKKITEYPIKIKYLFKVVKNYGSISRRKEKIIWKPYKDNYRANWDIDNLAGIWIKAINDTLVKNKIIIDDTVVFIKGGDYEVEFVDDIKKMEIILTFTL